MIIFPSRKALVRLHRWTGLFLTPFLLLIAVTGSIMAFYHELDEALNPALYHLEPQGELLEPLTLFSIAQAYSDQFSGVINQLPLQRESGKSVMYRVTGSPQLDQLFLNPYSGEVIGHRRWGDLTQGVNNTAGFIYLLHYRLLLPGKVGVLILGLVALLWTVDCITALIISLPTPHRGKTKKKSLWQRWKRVLSVRRSRKGLARLFDWHRAAGIWLWVMLLMFAWSGVGFNLPTVFTPVMSSLLDYQAPSHGLSKRENKVTEQPAISFSQALIHARHLSAQVEKIYKVAVLAEDSLSYSSLYGVYRYRIRSDRDFNEELSRTQVYFSANTGELIKVDFPSGQRSGNTVARWLYALHMGQVFGFAYKVLIVIIGLATCFFAYSGVVLWKKRSLSRKSHRST